ncbi:hypothetical protein [Sandarakinorhabdus rubra]|uniref:hypothetical protein n=1 Tax=Sandarakinorhabdus rubra TaxID=2672568 RepID=UPI0013D939EC|nr:hypothetical protein [Sandarakinorhabdus rubra]
MFNLISAIATGLALFAVGLAIAAWFRVTKALRFANEIEQWRKDAEASGDEALKRLGATERDRIILRRLEGQVEDLRERLFKLERRNDAEATMQRAPANSATFSSSISGSDRSIDVIPSVFTPPSPELPRDPYAYLLDNLRRDFNAAALKPSPDKLDELVAKHRLEDEAGGLWRMRLPDGRVAIMPGRAMLVGWAREYRGEMAKPLRDDHLAKWYDMTTDDVLALDRVAVRQPNGDDNRGVLRGI